MSLRKVRMPQTNIKWVAQVSLLKPGCSGPHPFVERNPGFQQLLSLWKHHPSLCHLDRSEAQWRDLCVDALTWKCFSTQRSHSILFEVDSNPSREANQVLVVAGEVGQAGISVIGLDRAEGEMPSIFYVQPHAHQQG
jgi:hypothetical protein